MKRIILICYLLLSAMVMQSYAQERRVTGVVTSSTDGSTLPGVQIVVKGTTIGTVTDVNGKYELNVPQGSTLLFTFIGLKTQEVAIGDKTIINIVMEEDISTLQEVVIVGYGTRIKSEVTGAVSAVKAEDIKGHTMPSLETALQGKTAGVHVQAGGGKLGQSVRTRVRGSSSISASNQPLYVIDGMPMLSQNLGSSGNEPTNPLTDLNPSDIESITVLKDASAAAIYGSRAANGVIIITTKKGKQGKTKFNVSSQLGFSEPANRVGFLNREQYINLFTESYNNVADETGSAYGFANVEEVLDWGFTYWRDVDDPTDITKGPDTNWEDQALQNGASRQIDVSASGGTDKTVFYAGLSATDQEGIVIGNAFDRINGRLNLEQKTSEYFKFGMNYNLSRSRTFRVANDNAFASPLQMVALSPLDPVYDPYTDELNSYTVYENGMIVSKYNNFDTEVFRNFGNAFAQINFFEGFSFRSEAGVDVLNQREMEYRGRLTNDGGPDGYSYDRTVTSKIYNLENYFTYAKLFGDFFDLNLVLGANSQMADFDFAEMSAKGFPSDEFRRIASAAEVTFFGSSGTGYRYSSLFSRASLKFYDKYLVSLSARRDGCSRFSKNNRYGVFPAVSAAWIVTNEDFLADNSVLSFLKPRLSWGLTGNSEINNFAARGLYTSSNYAGIYGVIPSSLESVDLKWETTSQIDIGIDFGFFNNRISGEIDYYIKNTTDLLLFVQLPATSGYSNLYKNIGSLENKGWEFLLNTVNIDKAFKWSSSFNIAFNKGKVTDIEDQIISVGIWRVMEGQPIGVFYTKEFAGVDPENGDALFYLNEEGDETTNDISQAANRVVGDPNPEFWGGLTNTFSFKGVDLSVLVQFVYGNDIYNGGRQWQADGFSWFDNQTLDFYEDHWSPENTDAKYPEPRLFEGNGYGTSSLLIFDGSYLRLKEVTLGYTLPKSLIRSIKLDEVRVFARAYNLLTFTNYPGWDPEADYLGTDVTNQTANIRQGYDFYTAPQPRTITFGINLGF